MLTIYPESELYQEIQRGNWKEESEIEKYKEIRTLLENLEIPTQFAALGASNAFQFQGTLPEDKDTLAAALDKIIETVKEDDLREYRINLMQGFIIAGFNSDCQSVISGPMEGNQFLVRFQRNISNSCKAANRFD